MLQLNMPLLRNCFFHAYQQHTLENRRHQGVAFCFDSVRLFFIGNARILNRQKLKRKCWLQSFTCLGLVVQPLQLCTNDSAWTHLSMHSFLLDFGSGLAQVLWYCHHSRAPLNWACIHLSFICTLSIRLWTVNQNLPGNLGIANTDVHQ